MIPKKDDGSQWKTSTCGKYKEFTGQIEKSQNDDRDYRFIRLSNELEVLLIQDAKTDFSSAALDVHVGHMSDPDDLPGLAHFCEHLLFMGTEKYPEENDYNKFLSEHSGTSNAYTGLDNTNYFFYVAHDFLEGALDRFAQFFISPLFSESCTERELKAVDSEHRKNEQSDSWRQFQLLKSLCNPSHPYSHFGTGSIETLSERPKSMGKDVRSELLAFHDKFYSANIMKLCILGRESLDQLSEWAVEKFLAVQNKQISVPTFPENPLTNLGKEVFMKPVKDNKSLELIFPFPDQTPLYLTKPSHYIAHLTGHEGPGSIFALLKKRGWANALQVISGSGAVGFEFTKVHVELTDDGLNNYELVVQVIFKYISLISKEIEERTFREVQLMADAMYRFQEKLSPYRYASSLAKRLQNSFAPEYVLSGACLIRDYDPDVILDCIKWLRPDNFCLFVISQHPPDNIKFTKKEKWYKTEYEIMDFTDRLKKALNNTDEVDGLHIPGPNAFIPENFEVNKAITETPLTKPDIVEDSSLLRLWHKKDDTFWIPKANVWVSFQSPRINENIGNNLKARLMVDLLKDDLNEYAYDAEMGDLAYNITVENDGIVLEIGGYNDKLSVLVEKVVEKIRDFAVDVERFKIIKEKLCKSYKNFSMEPPYTHALYYMLYLVSEKIWPPAEKMKHLETITAEQVQEFHSLWVSRLHLESLVHGNITRQNAKDMLSTVVRILHPSPLEPGEFRRIRCLMLPPRAKWVYEQQVENPNNQNSAIEYWIQIGRVTQVDVRARVSLLTFIMQEPFFDQLRTKEQLGYLVFSGTRRQSGVQGMRFIIQSERDPIYLESRIEFFLEMFRKDLFEMSEDRYQTHVKALIAKKLEKDKNLFQESDRYWKQIYSGFYEFNNAETDVKELETVTKESLIELLDQYVVPRAKLFRKVSVHMRSQYKSGSVKSIDLSSLLSKFEAHGIRCLTLEDLKHALEESDARDEAFTAIILRKLIDESEAEEEVVEEMMTMVKEIVASERPQEDAQNEILPLAEDNIVTKEVTTFKSQMTLAPEPTPNTPIDIHL